MSTVEHPVLLWPEEYCYCQLMGGETIRVMMRFKTLLGVCLHGDFYLWRFAFHHFLDGSTLSKLNLSYSNRAPFERFPLSSDCK